MVTCTERKEILPVDNGNKDKAQLISTATETVDNIEHTLGRTIRRKGEGIHR